MHKPFLNILSTLVDILRHFILYVAGNEQCNDNFIIMYSILEFPAGVDKAVHDNLRLGQQKVRRYTYSRGNKTYMFLLCLKARNRQLETLKYYT